MNEELARRSGSALERSWSAKTSICYSPSAVVSYGQCAPTAIVVWENFGGEILKTDGWPPNGRHFYNRIDGRRYDFTADQFEMPGYSHEVEYKDILSSADEAIPALSCTFKQGAAWSYDAGTYTRADPEPLAFGIEGIDLEVLTATLMIDGKAASRPMRVVRALNANHFLEVAQEGFLNVTTVFDTDAATGSRPAIHSRHLGLLGQPIFAQYAGFCSAR